MLRNHYHNCIASHSSWSDRIHVAKDFFSDPHRNALQLLVGLTLELGCLALGLAGELVRLALCLAGDLVCLALGLSGGLGDGLLYGLGGLLYSDEVSNLFKVRALKLLHDV
jgi:hypothetical protein